MIKDRGITVGIKVLYEQSGRRGQWWYLKYVLRLWSLAWARIPLEPTSTVYNIIEGRNENLEHKATWYAPIDSSRKGTGFNITEAKR
jgi:hypothetical protein